MISGKHLLVLFGLLAGLQARAEFRTWTDKKGNTLEAEFVCEVAGKITLRDRSGKEYRLPPEGLCKADLNLNKKVYSRIEQWRSRKLEGEYPYVYLDGICLKRSWGGEVKNVSVLVAIGVNAEGYREIIGAMEGEKEDKAGWLAFLRHLKQRGLKGVRLIVSDKCLGLVESSGEVFPDADWQRCVA